jgi:mRNA interferase MazF
MEIRRGDIVLVSLDPTMGSEIAKTRPCIVVSPQEMNRHAPTVIIAPLTTKRKSYPWRINCEVGDSPGQIMLDQIRAISKDRIIKWLDIMPPTTERTTLDRLAEMFAP